MGVIGWEVYRDINIIKHHIRVIQTFRSLNYYR